MHSPTPCMPLYTQVPEIFRSFESVASAEDLPNNQSPFVSGTREHRNVA